MMVTRLVQNAGTLSRWRSQSGFTLIELMIVVAVVGILAAIAIPAYTQYVEQSRRADGMDALQNTAQRLERCYTQYGQYDDGNCTVATNVQDGFDSPEGNYAVSTQAIDSTSFTLRAVPQGAQASDDCGTFTLTNTGVRDADGDDCWR